MPSTIEELGPLSRRLTVTIPPEAIRSAFDRHYRALSRETTLPGFRKGKVPRKVLERRFGDEVTKEVRKRIVTDALSEAFESHEIEPVEAPELDIDKIDLGGKEPIELVIEVEIRPHLDITDYQQIPVVVPETYVTDEEVDQALENLRRGLARLEKVEGGPVAPSDVLLGDVRYQFLDGTELPARPSRVADLRTGLVDDIPIENLTGEMVGKMPSDTVRLSGEIPKGFEPEDRAGQRAVIQFTIGAVHREAIPELDDAFATRLNVESLDALRERIRTRLESEKKAERLRQIEEECLDRLLERHEIDVPPRLLERRAKQVQASFREHLERHGVEALEIQRRLLEFDDESRTVAARSLRVGFVLDHIAEREELEITEQDFQEQIVGMARATGREPQEIFEDYQQAGLIPVLLSDIKRRKAREFLREHVGLADPQEGAEPLECTANRTTDDRAGAGPGPAAGPEGGDAAPEDHHPAREHPGGAPKKDPEIDSQEGPSSEAVGDGESQTGS